MQDRVSLKIAAVRGSIWEADDHRKHLMESTSNWRDSTKKIARSKKPTAFSGCFRPMRTHEYKASRVTDFSTSLHLKSYRSGNDYIPDTPTIKHPKPWDSTFTHRRSLTPAKEVQERMPDPYQDPTSYQYGSLPHILGLKGRLFMSKRAKVVTRMTAWHAKKKNGVNNNSFRSQRLMSPIRTTHRSRHHYAAV